MNEDNRLEAAIEELKGRIRILEERENERGNELAEKAARFAFPIGDARVGGGGHKLPYEPVFEHGQLADVEGGMWPFGRQFYTEVTLDDSAKTDQGMICLEISHPEYEQLPTAKILKIADAANGIENKDLTKTILPLYELKDGDIEIDYRCLMALAVRE